MTFVPLTDLAEALRKVQKDFGLDVISATMVLPDSTVTIRFTGVSSPIGVLEDDKGFTAAIHAS